MCAPDISRFTPSHTLLVHFKRHRCISVIHIPFYGVAYWVALYTVWADELLNLKNERDNAKKGVSKSSFSSSDAVAVLPRRQARDGKWLRCGCGVELLQAARHSYRMHAPVVRVNL
ncbi:hypothetical protein KQX54_005594 [Cotesia glomerata]|uniref:Uncharacterized protein n=1 Tax=Cotesia glomerata TaxID=32391 RepID=A0AAV7IK44_COTGL|nr:hypothetical protein KQX54_005594 [Cotesia glomerata]